MMEHDPRNRRRLKRPQARLEGSNYISIFTIIIFISISSYLILHLGFAATLCTGSVMILHMTPPVASTILSTVPAGRISRSAFLFSTNFLV